VTNPGRARQTDIYIRGLGGERPLVPTRLDALEARARQAMTPEAWAYIAGGAGQDSTIRANRDALERWRIVPRVLRDASVRDLSIELFGQTLPSPILLGPVGVLEMVHRDADLAVARAARAEGVPMIFSNQASVPMERCATVLGDSPHWFQLYWSTSNDIVANFVRRAEACRCGAIVVTLDTTMLGWRTQDLDLAWLPFLRGRGIAQYTSDPVFRAEAARHNAAPPASPRFGPALMATLADLFGASRRAGMSFSDMRRAVAYFTATYSRPSLQWSDLAYLRSITSLPIVLKGIQHADDARRAADSGIDGIVVSNHGGRQVDGAIGSLDALPAIVEAAGGRMPILFDSGVRSGMDVFKALALGATAVLLGRSYAYGLAIGGEAGVREVIRDYIAELDLTLGLSGHTSVRTLSSAALARV
jgi:isopentenyl diphosphate isomerase/L-lactate dehydrogenase-like FMN-dependent dehydrogenase